MKKGIGIAVSMVALAACCAGCGNSGEWMDDAERITLYEEGQYGASAWDEYHHCEYVYEPLSGEREKDGENLLLYKVVGEDAIRIRYKHCKSESNDPSEKTYKGVHVHHKLQGEGMSHKRILSLQPSKEELRERVQRNGYVYVKTGSGS